MRRHHDEVLPFLVRRFRWGLLVAVIASLLSGSCGVLLVAQITAALTSPKAELQDIAIRFAAAAVGVMLASLVANISFLRLRQRAMAELRQFISDGVLNAPCRSLEEVGPPRVQAALSEHAGQVAEFFVSLPMLVTNGTIVVGCLVYLVVLSPQVFLVTLPFIVLGALAYHLANLKAIGYLRAGSVEEERLFEHFRSLTNGAKELRLNSAKRTRFRGDVLQRSIESVRHLRTTGLSLFSVASSWGNFLIYAFLGTVLFVFSTDLLQRSRVLTGFALVMVYIVNPLQTLLLSIPNASLVRVSAARIRELMDRMRSVEESEEQPAAMSFRSLVLKGVTHRYYHEQANEFFQLGPIDLAFRPGEVTFVVGGNGSGKTTLTKILVGLYPPDEGWVELDGERIDDANRDRFRQCFSAIFSDFHLFEGLLDDASADLDARGNELLRQFHLQHKVRIQDGVFSTSALSQGQRKRLALVVSYLEDRPILMFDEWAADQDPAFKDVFYRDILSELRDRGKAVIVISHDDRYFHLADRVVLLENGHIRTPGKAWVVGTAIQAAVD